MKKSLIAVLILVGGMAYGAPARADQNPPNCTGNELDLEIDSSLTWVRNGDVIVYNISAANDRGTPCDVTNATITINLPGPDGNPSATSTPVASGVNLLAGTHEKFIGAVPWTVNLNPGVRITQATAHGHGTLWRNPLPGVFIDTGDIAKTLSTAVTHPHMTISKVASPLQGVAPFTTTYTYLVHNDGDADIVNPVITDNLCSPVKYASGDVNGDGILQTTETWTETCTQTFPAAGVYVNTANVCGTTTTDKAPICAGPVQAQVVVTAPLAAPAPVPQAVAAPAVKPASVPNTCIDTPKSLALRAKELTTVRVSLNDKVKGVKVTIKGPGFTKHGTTNSKGEATFKVRPTKAGTLTITSAQCAKVSKSEVKAARKTQSRQLPKVTG